MMAVPVSLRVSTRVMSATLLTRGTITISSPTLRVTTFSLRTWYIASGLCTSVVYVPDFISACKYAIFCINTRYPQVFFDSCYYLLDKRLAFLDDAGFILRLLFCRRGRASTF